jgi:DNA-binding NarL/FixJ family response regulator
MDLQMPVMGGLAAIGNIHTQQPEVRIIVLTTYDSDADILPAIEAGAAGYLLKDAPPDALFRAVRGAGRSDSCPQRGTETHAPPDKPGENRIELTRN